MRTAVVLVLALSSIGFLSSLGAEVLQEAEASPGLLEQIRAHRTGIRIWWTGHNGWLIASDSLLVATDLVLEDPARMQPSPVTAEEVAQELDISFITHSHGDHFHRRTSRILLEKSNCVFVMPASCLEIARRLEIPEHRIRVAVPGEPFELQGARVRPVRAIHGNNRFAVYEKANLQDCGYQIEIDGKTFFQPGDSVLLEDQLFLGHVDVLFFSPTIHNMHIDRSVILINELNPDYVLPQHRDTYRQTEENRFWTHGYAREVKALLSKSLQERYFMLEIGQSLQIE